MWCKKKKEIIAFPLLLRPGSGNLSSDRHNKDLSLVAVKTANRDTPKEDDAAK